MEFTIGDWVTIIIAGSAIVALGETASRLLLGALAQLQYNRKVKQAMKSSDGLANEIQAMFANAFVPQDEEGDDTR